MSLNYEKDGSGPIVILVPGMIVSQKDWRLVRPMLAAAWFQAISVDPPGHGESPKPEDPDAYTPEAILNALEGWIADGGQLPGQRHPRDLRDGEVTVEGPHLP